MSESLDAMVKAMAEEFERQKAEDAAKQWGKGGLIKSAEASRRFNSGETDDGRIQNIYVMGRFDLEKVARAGLAAIRDPGDLVGLALDDLSGEYRPGSHSAFAIWQAKIDRILR